MNIDDVNVIAILEPLYSLKFVALVRTEFMTEYFIIDNLSPELII